MSEGSWPQLPGKPPSPADPRWLDLSLGWLSGSSAAVLLTKQTSTKKNNVRNTAHFSNRSRCSITYSWQVSFVSTHISAWSHPLKSIMLYKPASSKSNFLINGFLGICGHYRVICIVCVCVCVCALLVNLFVCINTVPVRSCGGLSFADSLTCRQGDESFPSGWPPPSPALHTCKHTNIWKNSVIDTYELQSYFVILTHGSHVICMICVM